MERSTTVCGIAVAVIALLQGCASVRSTPLGENPAKVPAGLVYFLPYQNIRVTVVVDAKGDRTLSAAAGPMLPDHANGFVAEFVRNSNGKSTLELGVTPLGLLNSEQKGAMDSTAGDLAQALGQAAGTLGLHGIGEPAPGPTCDAPGTYQRIIDPMQREAATFCGFSIAVANVPGPKTLPPTACAERDDDRGGVFYRQAAPVSVVATRVASASGSVTQTDLNIVTQNAPCRFLNVPRSVVADSSWSMTFVDGVPTAYKPTASSEVVGVLGFPAEVIAAYSTALTAGFTRRKSEESGQKDALNAERERAIAELKLEACRLAVASGDITKATEACK